jgi:hypothetical protein
MNKIDAPHTMRLLILKLKDEINLQEKTIDDCIKKIASAEKEIESIKILLENANLPTCATPRTLRAYENEQ